MDTTTTLTVAHGLDIDRVVAAEVTIRNDADSAHRKIGSAQIGISVDPAGYFYVDATTVYMERATGGLFDQAGFVATSYNRGWVVFTVLA
jgi:predicted sugar kinase